MDIIYKTGSILDAPEQYIVHGCNAQGAMGSGVAKVLYERYPDVKRRYLAAHAYTTANNKPFLGTVHIAHTGLTHIVFNAITQEFYGDDGKLYVSYDALEQCMKTLDRDMALVEQATGETPAVAMPLIGCGLAGGDWIVVSEIIKKQSQHFQPVVYTLDGFVPGYS